MLTGILPSASHLRVEPSGRVRIPVVPTVKTKTRHETVFLFLFWRATIVKNMNTLIPEIIKMAQYISISGILRIVGTAVDPGQKNAESSPLLAS